MEAAQQGGRVGRTCLCFRDLAACMWTVVHVALVLSFSRQSSYGPGAPTWEEGVRTQLRPQVWRSCSWGGAAGQEGLGQS